MVSLSITIWRGQGRVSAWEGFLTRPPRADRGRFSAAHALLGSVCPGMEPVLLGLGQSRMQGSSHSLSQTSSSHQRDLPKAPGTQHPSAKEGKVESLGGQVLAAV